MNITKHITFFYVEERIPYIERLIQEASKYKYITDIFIHTNKNDFKIDIFDKYINGKIYVIYHDLTNVNPFTLTTKSRDLLCKQKNDYDIFMYIEDDMLFPCQALEYWLQHNESLIELQNVSSDIFKSQICFTEFINIDMKMEEEIQNQFQQIRQLTTKIKDSQGASEND